MPRTISEHTVTKGGANEHAKYNKRTYYLYIIEGNNVFMLKLLKKNKEHIYCHKSTAFKTINKTCHIRCLLSIRNP